MDIKTSQMLRCSTFLPIFLFLVHEFQLKMYPFFKTMPFYSVDLKNKSI